MKIYLLGFMGAGKSTVGRRLAQKLNYRFIDMDEVIEKEEGLSVSELFNIKGEEWFRGREGELLHELASIGENLVISTGGGVPCFGKNMEQMNTTGFTIYLELSVQALFKRLKTSRKSDRPLLKAKSDEELLDFIKTRLEEREVFYRQAKLVFPAENIQFDQLINSIAT
ncbi:MAG: shikimate kinase [Bacteroidales bacterium]|nr:shikimate kinase [Bacteroidales bacterium]MCB9000236.1 shikimate kinase [Bacteroidales bacterium]MCB9013355.1 shikimate kinase [Bacteroidales bacterium]